MFGIVIGFASIDFCIPQATLVLPDRGFFDLDSSDFDPDLSDDYQDEWTRYV